MKALFRSLLRLVRGALLLAGLAAALFAAVQFTDLPWRAYKSLSQIPDPSAKPPTHILLMGGSGIPGESGLMRTFYAAQAARQHPKADVLIALPLGAAQSESSRAYLDELRLRGVAGSRLRILDNGRNTREQALRLVEYLSDKKSPSLCVLVITDPEHIRRTAACIRKAAGGRQLDLPLAVFPALPLFSDAPLPWRADELDTPGPAPRLRSAIPDIGSSLRLRYNLWANLGYSNDSLREAAALVYYRLRGWL